MSEEQATEIEKKIDRISMKIDRNGAVDNWLGKIASRKLLVWTVACVALFLSQINSEDWVAISLAYIGSQALVDLASKWRSAGSPGRRGKL